MADAEKVVRELYSDFYKSMQREFGQNASRWHERHRTLLKKFAKTLIRATRNASSADNSMTDEALSDTVKQTLIDDDAYTVDFVKPAPVEQRKSGVPNSVNVLHTADGAAMGALFAMQIFKSTRDLVDTPNAQGVFSPWHYGLFSLVAGITIASFVNNIRLASKSANINRHTVTALGIQSGVTATLGTTVLGGFASQALAAAGPIGFFVINAGMLCKTLFDGFRSLWHANKLRRAGFGDTPAYHTYCQRAKQHFKAAAMRGLTTAGIGLVVAFAPYVAIGISIFTACVVATVKIIQTLPKLIAGVKRIGSWLGDVFTRHRSHNNQQAEINRVDQNAQALVIHAPAIATVKGVEDAIKDKQQLDAVRQWKRERNHLHSHSGLRSYDARFNYRDDQLLVIASAYQESPNKGISVMRDRILAILHEAMYEYTEKSHHPSLKVNAAQMNKKLRLIQAMAEMVIAGGITLNLNQLQDLVRQHNGGWFVRGALGSMNKRVGGMQSVVEAVEFYTAFLKANGIIANIDVNKLHYQCANAYSLTGRQTRRRASQQFSVRLFKPNNAAPKPIDVSQQTNAATQSEYLHA